VTRQGSKASPSRQQAHTSFTPRVRCWTREDPGLAQDYGMGKDLHAPLTLKVMHQIIVYGPEHGTNIEKSADIGVRRQR